MSQSMQVRNQGRQSEDLRDGAHKAVQESQLAPLLEWGGGTQKQESMQHFTLFSARSIGMSWGISKEQSRKPWS